MQIKLELLDIGRNQGETRLCCGCHQTEHVIEHVIACRNVKEMVGLDNPPKLDNMNNKSNLLRLHSFVTAYIKRRDEDRLKMNDI